MKIRYFGIYVVILVILFLTGCKERVQSQNQSTISVIGTGTVMAQPDMLQMNISLWNIARTTQLAREEVSIMVRQALTILKENNVEDKNISTSSLTFRTEYDYSSGRRILTGQRAEQVITFSIEDIRNNNSIISIIIDRLTQINGIQLNQMNFSIKNNTEYFIRSRELAFQKATEKANQYAELSGLKIVKVLSISEDGTQYISPMNNRAINQVVLEGAASKDEGSTIVPVGELEITTRIIVVFLLE